MEEWGYANADNPLQGFINTLLEESKTSREDY